MKPRRLNPNWAALSFPLSNTHFMLQVFSFLGHHDSFGNPGKATGNRLFDQV